MALNRNYAKFGEDGVIEYAPKILDWVKVHVDEYPETVCDEETGECRETGKMLSYEWEERKRTCNPSRGEYADMGYYRLTAVPPKTPPDEGKAWSAVGDGRSVDDYNLDFDAMTAVRRHVQVAVEAPPPAPEEPVPGVVDRRWTRLSFIRTLKSVAMWTPVREMMSDDDLIEFLACDYILESDPAFVRLFEAARVKFGADVVDGLLDSIPVEE